MSQAIYTYKIGFQVNTQDLKAQLAQVQQQLQAIGSGGIAGPLTSQMLQASQAAAELSAHLKAATNVDTGKLDLTKLNASLKASGTTLSSYSAKLAGIGVTGQQAFLGVAQAVLQAEMPMRRMSTLSTKLWTTLQNTARWQISSAALRALTTGVSTAYQYAQDLDKSLNNIRIVTGQSTENMAKFAKEANKAAKAMSTDTLAYTDASLIYYQQGLDNKAVKERTDVTVKLANVTGESAETVSNWMTAIWNNFDNGSKSLEYYADVLTKLGAATASSSDEIAGGLEKFAAVADTVGLSYEYAAAALATVTAETRQSEDVVGTAFKTIFARIEGLNLGETQEDGTTYNKYSEALATVGVQIKDSNGQLKQMDQILDELGTKWDTIGKDQQIALAQSVGGLRQYNQMIALMDNWDKVKENIDRANGATGELNNQQEIYAQSWEAANNRVKASGELIYNNLIKSESMIELMDGVSQFLDLIGKATESMGGMSGALSLLVMLVTKMFSTQIINGLSNFAYNIGFGTGKIQEQTLAMKEQAATALKSAATMQGLTKGTQIMYQTIGETGGAIGSLKSQYNALSEAQRVGLGIAIETLETIKNQTLELAKQNSTLENSVTQRRSQVAEYLGNTKLSDDKQGNINLAMANASNSAIYAGKAQGYQQVYNTAMEGIAQVQYNANLTAEQKAQQMEIFEQQIKEVTAAAREMDGSLTNLSAKEIFGAKTVRDGKIVKSTMGELGKKAKEASDGIEQARTKLNKLLKGSQRKAEIVGMFDELVAKSKEFGTSTSHLTMSQKQLQQELGRTKIQAFNTANGMGNWAKSLTSAASSLSTLSFGLSSLSSITKVWKDDTMSLTDKVTSFAMSISFLIPALLMLSKGIKSINDTSENGLAIKLANLLSLDREEAQIQEIITTKTGEVIVRNESTEELWEELAAQEGNTLGLRANTKETWKNIGAQIARLWWIGLIIAAIVALVLVYKSLIASYEAENKAVENAIENERMLQQAYEDTKKAYDDLKSTIKDYNESVDAISKMTKGTLEFKEAVLEANQAALELIRTNKLGADSYYIEDGLIKIKQAALDKLIENGLKEVEQSMIVANTASWQRANAELELEKENIVWDGNASEKKSDVATAAAIGGGALGLAGGIAAGGTAAGTAIASAAAAAGAGAAAGSVVPVVGTIIGAAVGLIVAGISVAAVDAQKEAEEKVLSDLSDYIEENGNSVFASKEKLEAVLKQELHVTDQGLIDKLTENIEATQQNTEAILGKKTAAENEQEIMIRSWLDANGGETWKNASDEEKQVMVENYKNKIDLENSKEATDVEKLRQGTNKDYWREYMIKVLGETTISESNNKLSGEKYVISEMNGDQAKIQVRGADGQLQDFGTGYITQKDSKDTLTMAKTMETWEAGSNTVALDDYNKKLASMGIGENLGGYSKEQIQSIFSAIPNIEDLSLDKLFDLGLMTKDDAQAYIDARYSGLEAENQMKVYEQKQQQQQSNRLMGKIKTDEEEEDRDKNQILSKKNVPIEAWKKYVEQIKKANKLTDQQTDLAEEMAESHLINTARIEDLNTVFEEQKDALANSGTPEYFAALESVRTAATNLLGVDLGAQFFQNAENLELVNQAANGSYEAFQRLREIGAQKIIDDANIADIKVEIDGITKTFQEAFDELPTLKPGEKVDITNWTDTLNKLIEDYGLTWQQIESMLAGKNIVLPKPVWHWGGDKQATPDEIYEMTGSIMAASEGDFIEKLSGEAVGGMRPTPKLSSSDGGDNKKKSLEEEKERYHTINQLIEYQTEHLGKLADAKDRAFGSQKLELFAAELRAIDEETELLNQKLLEAQGYLTGDLQKLTDSGINVEYDKETGVVTNYDSIIEQLVNMYNEAQGNEERQEEIENLFGDYEKFEESLTTYVDLNEQIKDQELKKRELILEQRKATLEIIKSWQDFYDKNRDIELNLFKITNDAGKVIAKELNLATQQLATQVEFIGNNILPNLTQNLTELLTTEGLDSNLTDLIAENQDEIGDFVSNLSDTVEKISSALSDGIDVLNEEFDLLIGDVSKYEGIIENAMSLYEFLDKNGLNTQKRLAEATQKSSTELINLQKMRYEELKEIEKTAKSLWESDLSNQGYKEAYLAAKAATEEGLNALMEQGQKALEATTQVYEKTLKKARQDFEKALAGDGGFEALQNRYDAFIEADERHLDQVNATYEQNKWNLKIQKELDKTTNKAAIERYKQLQKEFELRKSANKLTQYDLDMLEAKYELTQAQIALEEARDNKVVARLTRNAMGGYGFVYGANASEVAAAEEKLADAENKAYNLAKDQLNSLVSDITSAMSEFADIDPEAADAEAQRDAILKDMEFKYKEFAIASKDFLGAGGSSSYLDDLEDIIGSYSSFSSKAKEYVGQVNQALETRDTNYNIISGLLGDEITNVDGIVKTLNTNIKIATSNAKDFSAQIANMFTDIFGNIEELGTQVTSKLEDAQKAALMLDVAALAQKDAKDHNQAEWDAVIVRAQDMGVDEETLKSIQKLADLSGANAYVYDQINAGRTLEAQGQEANWGWINEIDQYYTGGNNKTIIEEETEKSKKAKAERGAEAKKIGATNNKQTNNIPQTTNQKGTSVSASNDIEEEQTNQSEANIQLIRSDLVIGKNKIYAKRNLESHGFTSITLVAGMTTPDFTKDDKVYKTSPSLDDPSLTLNTNIQLFYYCNSKKGASFKSNVATHKSNRHIPAYYFSNGKPYAFAESTSPDLQSKRTYKIQDVKTTADGQVWWLIKAGGSMNNGPEGSIEPYDNDLDSQSYNLYHDGWAWFKKTDLNGNITMLDTGGYTGEWGDTSGKLAMLHEKELILNKEDTAKILSSVGIVRSINFEAIGTTLEKLTSIGMSMLGGMLNNNIGYKTQEKEINQNVKIEASFPGVQSAFEIEMALNNLVNDASQYATDPILGD